MDLQGPGALCDQLCEFFGGITSAKGPGSLPAVVQDAGSIVATAEAHTTTGNRHTRAQCAASEIQQFKLLTPHLTGPTPSRGLTRPDHRPPHASWCGLGAACPPPACRPGTPASCSEDQGQGHQMGHQMLTAALPAVACCQLLAVSCLLPVACCQLLAASCLLPVACCQLLAASCLLPVADCQCMPPDAGNQVLVMRGGGQWSEVPGVVPAHGASALYPCRPWEFVPCMSMQVHASPCKILQSCTIMWPGIGRAAAAPQPEVKASKRCGLGHIGPGPWLGVTHADGACRSWCMQNVVLVCCWLYWEPWECLGGTSSWLPGPAAHGHASMLACTRHAIKHLALAGTAWIVNDQISLPYHVHVMSLHGLHGLHGLHAHCDSSLAGTVPLLPFTLKAAARPWASLQRIPQDHRAPTPGPGPTS
ncbi:hypothetical protein HaLaN_12247 [Haematococcus lacustris]|uniref:Uncharacterized protein n=1 Tax=Haematococcus lacustris TaxID=44745 RepID=A0A699Z1L9_HAELA|nr:hypothetical protein HaLaN_12247 [Haematococcus lacustris]